MVTAAQFEKLAMSMPGAEAKAHFEQPDFRVKNKIFVGMDTRMKRGTLKLTPEAQEVLLRARPEAYEAATGAWGRKGWTWVHLSKVTLAELTPLVEAAWRSVAPKSMVKALESGATPQPRTAKRTTAKKARTNKEATAKPAADGEWHGANPLTISAATLARLRRICLALPEATEKEAWGDPTWRVKDKIFAMQKGNFEGGRPSLWMKAPGGAQEALVAADPELFFRPPYVGHKGWIGVYLDGKKLPWDAIASHVREAYRLTAPKRLAALL